MHPLAWGGIVYRLIARLKMRFSFLGNGIAQRKQHPESVRYIREEYKWIGGALNL